LKAGFNNLLRNIAFVPIRRLGFAIEEQIKLLRSEPSRPFAICQKLKITKKHADLRVLVQTDRKQVRDYFLSEIGPAAFYIEEMPVTCSSSAMHIATEKQFQI
jgi:hypothetical protein